MESGATEATFAVNYNWKGTPGGGIPNIILKDPSGNIVKPTYIDDTHQLFRVELPQSGPWTVEIDPTIDEFSFNGKYLIEASVKSKATLEVFLGIPPDERIVGAKLPILAFLTDTQPITGATVNVEITTPELGTTPSEKNTLKLYDDGQHDDGKANDGVYGGIYSGTDREGIYNMKVNVDAYSPLVGNFKREAKLAFNMRGDKDSDNDGLPDTWEIDNGLDPNSNVGDNGSEGDPDGDGLKNKDEFRIGTLPLDPDTDNGGENDGSEVQNGRNPTDPADDQVLPPTSLRAIPGVNSVNLTIGILPEHDKLIIYRAKSSEGPWTSFEINPTNLYTDRGLDNDVTYYYKVVGVVQSKKSAPTRIVSAMPKADPIPPSGYVVINDGAAKTNTEDVVLTIRSDPDTIEMKVSNDPELIDANWETFNKSKIWTLLPGKGLRTVYVLFRDAAGNIGPRSVYDPSVDIRPAMDSIIIEYGNISGRKFNDFNGNGAMDQGETGIPNWTIELRSSNGALLNNKATDSDGKYSFTKLPIDNYIVGETYQKDWIQTLPSGGTYTVNLSENDDAIDKNFGNFHKGKITGGGWITITGDPKATFGIEGQYPANSNTTKGNIEYQDLATKLNIKSIQIKTVATTLDKKKGIITGLAQVNSAGSYPFEVYVEDNGEPGKGSDIFKISLPTYPYSNGAVLSSGNIQVHE